MLPYRNFRFRLEIDGLDAGSFSEVSGFDATMDVVEYRAGDDPALTPTKLPGLIKYGNITLKWGAAETMVLYDWLIDITEGTIEKKTVTLTALDEEGARALVLARIPGAAIVEFERDSDDGRTIYKGEAVLDGWEYDFEIDAASGEFIKWEADNR